MDIRFLGPDDAAHLEAAAHLFDHRPEPAWSAAFLASPTHHLAVAFVEGDAAGFVTGIAIHHPDKEAEMLLYELGVDEGHRRQGVGTALVAALRDRALDAGMRGMWVPIAAGDDIAAATYTAAGATDREDAEIVEWDFHEPSA